MNTTNLSWARTTSVLVLIASCLGAGRTLHAATFYVSSMGLDRAPGTKEQPLASLEGARDAARLAGAGPHRIVVEPGEYFLATPLELDPRDNGLTIEAGTAGKAVLYGGRLVTGWRRDGANFWCADLPSVKDGTWDFRALVVNGRMPQRARYPEAGTFLNRGTWNLPLLSAVAGHWERKPTHEELTTMPYDPKDIPETLDVKNAEVRLYHMWNESLVGVSRNDIQKHELILSPEPIWPPGALRIKTYLIWNTREGMTQPGQWYLDRTAGRVVYWPLKGEDMTVSRVIAPTTERILAISGNSQKKVEGIVVRGLTLQATTVPLKPGGFGAGAFDGAISMSNASRCEVVGVEICNVGGLGIGAQNTTWCRIVDCRIHHAGACGVRVDGSDTVVLRNHIHHVGVYYPSAAALIVRGQRPLIQRNEIHDAPYCGIITRPDHGLIEENIIYRVMLEMHDGAAIYGNMSNTILRGNLVRDVIEYGKGYGASAYYLDEGAHDCVIERNVALGVPTPLKNHITRNIVIRDNVFIAENDMRIAFGGSAACTFERNTLFAPGKITITPTSAIKVWNNNRLFHDGTDKTNNQSDFVIDDTMPASEPLERRTKPIDVVFVTKAPTLDGEVATEEWPRQFVTLSRNRLRQPASGAPVFARFSHDGRFLYVAVTIPMFQPAKISAGATWKTDDGIEISLAGTLLNGQATTYVVRGYANGTVVSVDDAGAPPDGVTRLGKEVRFSAKITRNSAGNPRGWQGEWAIPFEALGMVPSAGEKIPFNIAVYYSEHDEWHCWEGTLADESWRLSEAGMLQLQ